MSRWHGGADLRCCRTEFPTGELIEVVVLSIKGNRVKLGTDAPPDIPIVREELLKAGEQ